MAKKFQQPKEDWQPYRIAYLTGDGTVRKVLTNELSIITSNLSMRIFEFVSAELCFERAEWCLTTRYPDTGKESVCCYPLFDVSDEQRWSNFINDQEKIENLKGWLEMSRIRAMSYLRKLENGERSLYARASILPSSEFEEIPPDLIASFVVDDVHKGNLICPITGDRLFSAHVGPAKAAKMPKSKPGRTPKYDWTGAKKHLLDLLDQNGSPTPEDIEWKNQSDMEKAVASYFRSCIDEEPARSLIRTKVKAIHNEWLDSKANS